MEYIGDMPVSTRSESCGEQRQPFGRTADCDRRFNHVGDVSRKCRLSVGSLKAMRVLQLALKKIQSLRKDFVGEDVGRRHPITQDKSWESGLLLLVISNRPLLRVMHTGLFQDLPTAP